MSRVKRYGNYLVWSMIVLYVVFLVRCVPAKWWFKRVYQNRYTEMFSVKEIIAVKKVDWFLIYLENHLKLVLTCLERSIAKKFILSFKGVKLSIAIGIHRSDNRIVAHAWLQGEYYDSYKKLN